MTKQTYDHKALESQYVSSWKEGKVYEFEVNAENKQKFYNLMMFPYPSAEGLHVGNMYAFTGADVFGRFNRMNQKAVFEPIGLDGFGIHSENYAIKVGRHPKDNAEITQKNFYRQLSGIGNAFSWDYRLETYDPEYYKWTQWLFIQAFNKGLAYKDTAIVNWCPDCKTVLADEQVENGKCERCKNQVERREMSSWFIKITDYADRLLENIDKISWPEKIKIAQRQWIGKKSGAVVTFDLKVTDETLKDRKLKCFTTRLDTVCGVTFIVMSPELAKKWIKNGWNASKDIKVYINESLNKSDQQRKEEAGEKTGVNSSVVAINPVNGNEIPVFVSDYVLADVGTGAVMGVPAHDQRDFDFAGKYDLSIKQVIGPEVSILDSASSEKGKLINSGKYDDMGFEEAVSAIIKDHSDKIHKEFNYHLRDWGMSRQRYWGPPIPMINCEKCGWVPVPTKDLPVRLPDIDDFKPKGDGTSPLENAPDEWKNVDCPKCGGKATRELDVSDTFLDSSWYFLAYPNLKTKEWKSDESPFNPQITKNWLPVDAYIGGAEHAVLHLLYARFITMMLKDMGYIDFEEPFPFLFGHGLIIKDGAKMSKSKGNIIVPETYIEKYGADTFRTYLMFLAPYDQGGDFRDSGVEGMRRFIDKFYLLVSKYDGKNKDISEEVRIKLNQTIKKVTNDISNFRYNTAISAVMELINLCKEEDVVSTEVFKPLTQMLAPFAPFVTEKVWTDILGQEFSVHNSKWPEFDTKYITDKTQQIAVQVNGKLRATLEVSTDAANDKEKIIGLAKEDQNISKYIESGIAKEVFIPGKILNFVTK